MEATASQVVNLIKFRHEHEDVSLDEAGTWAMEEIFTKMADEFGLDQTRDFIEEAINQVSEKR